MMKSTKALIAESESKLRDETTAAISGAVEPLKADIADIRTQMAKFSSGSTGLADRSSKQQIDLMNSMDIANCQVAFIGFQTESLTDRVQAIQSIVNQVGAGQPLHIGHFYKGPRNARVLAPASYAQFASEQDARSFLSSAGGKGKSFASAGATLVLKPAKTRANVMRDGALKAASNKLKAAAPGRNVKVDYKERSVSVDGVVAFSQDAGDLSGRFLPPIANLSI